MPSCGPLILLQSGNLQQLLLLLLLLLMLLVRAKGFLLQSLQQHLPVASARVQTQQAGCCTRKTPQQQ